jgi:hypothetical protein
MIDTGIIYGILGVVLTSIFKLLTSTIKSSSNQITKLTTSVFNRMNIKIVVIVIVLATLAIFFNLSIGFIAIIIFYFLIVRMPNMKKKKLLKNNLAKHYFYFKKNCLQIFCNAMNEQCNLLLIDKLMSQNEFKIFFETKISNSQTKWDTVLNGLDNQLTHELLTELELFKNEIELVNNNIDIDDKDVFAFIKELSVNIYRLKNINSENDNARMLFIFIWQLFSGWSFIDGYKKDDIVKVMISKI